MAQQVYNFCTLFDSYYILKGLALYKSLEKVCSDFCLYIMAFDEECYEKLQALGLRKAVICKLDDFETDELLNVKKSRTKAEYCWTCGPSVIDFFIEKYNLQSCTYLDSDLMFVNSPQIIFNEFSDNTSVAITEHFHDDVLGGRYCVQFMYFRNDEYGREALEWWKKKCIEWCYAKFENGKYGDQKYLDQFPLLFKNVYIVRNRGGGIAPWNMHIYQYQQNENTLTHENVTYDCVFFHFHGIKIERHLDKLILKAVTYDVSDQLNKLFFFPYLKLISTVYLEYFGIEICSVTVQKRRLFEKFYSYMKAIFRKNKLFQVIYYSILRVRYNGYESKKEI